MDTVILYLYMLTGRDWFDNLFDCDTLDFARGGGTCCSLSAYLYQARAGATPMRMGLETDECP